MEKTRIGQTADKAEISAYTIRDPKTGMEAELSDYGAILLALRVPVKGDGSIRDVVLGYEKIESYFACDTNYGGTVGPSANRIGGASFTLNGEVYELDKNDGRNTLHSGFSPFNKRMWRVDGCDDCSITLSIRKPDRDLGFPGNMEFTVCFTLWDGALIIDYTAVSDKDTIFNPTNHSYFNLKGAGTGSALDHSLLIRAKTVTYADEHSIPDGQIRLVEGTPMDFTEAHVIGDRIEADYDLLRLGQGYDHNYILEKTDELLSDRFSDERVSVHHAARLAAPDQSVIMDAYTDMPGVQLYTGNFISPDDAVGKGGVSYVRRGGVCLETQYYPNAINIPTFPQPILKAGEQKRSRTVYAFS